ncbi:DUF2267 domain-containing protein [Aurantimonas aggregata]|uniref:DUF2267 domain-containing protein n=2 Tax=Aurantimonas aggregata TaxID=2047720 RepID=A0A6L9MDE7_9HYPH|nr:DUF2267 domain-containing protein [Aurantimonas aggregata]NDV85805.1 DUF2267 domain-containing protein [Aurantimonas aggregata]
MDELLTRITAETGLDTATAKRAVGSILAFLSAESDDPAVGTMIKETPGAEDAMAATGGDAYSGGGIMALGAGLMGMGLDMGQIQTVAQDLVAYSKIHAGADTVDRVIASVPGLAQFV